MRLTEDEYERLISRVKVQKPVQMVPPPAAVKAEKKRTPNKTEAAYARILSLEYPGAKVRYEAITLRLDAGFRYTADWCVTLATGETILVEVKNAGFKHASYGRSKLAFSQAVIDFPMFKFRWAEKDKTGWTVTDY